MAENRSKAIIAVFGGNDSNAVALARGLGFAIAKCDQILLTGGTGRGKEASVKESAIAGVGSQPWVGVERADRIAAAQVDTGFVIYSDIGHRRNYLEACLCDAAIGLKGGDGTISEVTFSLALHRPVALVGDHWRESGSLDGRERSEVTRTMVDRAFHRVGKTPSGRHDLDQLLNEDTIRVGLRQLPPYRYFPSVGAAELVLDWILGEVRSYPKAGSFPTLSGYEQVAAAYQQWLEKYAV